jgi:hypothetical protein
VKTSAFGVRKFHKKEKMERERKRQRKEPKNKGRK